ncbi:MAG: hypothetical protein AAGG51_03585 [Cyanobacteria bacterium P01_G01_bin.54]
MRYPLILPYPKCVVRALISLAGAALISFATLIAVGLLLKLLELINAFNGVFHPPIALVVLSCLVGLPLLGMAHLRQLCRLMSVALDGKRIAIKPLPVGRYWFAALGDWLIVLLAAGLAGSLWVGPRLQTPIAQWQSPTPGVLTSLAGIAIAIASYLYYIGELIIEGREQARKVQNRQRHRQTLPPRPTTPPLKLQLGDNERELKRMKLKEHIQKLEDKKRKLEQ